jgi:hypothetical protein
MLLPHLPTTAALERQDSLQLTVLHSHCSHQRPLSWQSQLPVTAQLQELYAWPSVENWGPAGGTEPEDYPPLTAPAVTAQR